MNEDLGDLRFEVRWLEPATARAPRAAQRNLALAISADAGPGWPLSSRSHARGAVVVALGRPPVSRLGVDVERLDPSRPWDDIARLVLGERALEARASASAWCRAWTFGEAYFKAFGSRPETEIVLDVVRTVPKDEQPHRLGVRRFWRQWRLRDDFWMTLVWESGA